jgi:hypothetical protein
MKHAIRVRGLAYPNCAHIHLPHQFCSSYEYLIHFQREDSRAHSMVI